MKASLVWHSKTTCAEYSNQRYTTLALPAQPTEVRDRTFSCWICQEELESQTLLLEHYDNHMR